MKWEVRRVHRGSWQRTSVPAHSLVPHEKKLTLVGTTVECGGESLTAGAGAGSCEFTTRKQKVGQKLDRTIELQVTQWPTSSCVVLQLPQAAPPSGGCSGSESVATVAHAHHVCCWVYSLWLTLSLPSAWFIYLISVGLCVCCCLESIKTYPVEQCEFWMVVAIVTAQNCGFFFFFCGNLAFLVLELKPST